MVENLSKAIQILDRLIAKAEELGDSVTSFPSKSVKAQNAGIPVPQKKAAKVAKASAGLPAKEVSDEDAFAKAKLVVGLVKQVEELSNSDKLYSLFYNEESARPDISICQQIIAGLRKHVSKEGLLGKTVAVIANLKTAKLAGETSEGMILAAVCKGDEYDHGELVRPLQPPADASPGEPIYLEGSSFSDVYPKECKQWKKLQPELAVRTSLASFKGRKLICASGRIQADEIIPEGASIS